MHLYRPFEPGGQDNPPGDDHRHTYFANDFRCIFSFTETPEGLYRDLSVSVPIDETKRNTPHPAAVAKLCVMFGFSVDEDISGMWSVADVVRILNASNISVSFDKVNKRAIRLSQKVQ